MKLIHLTKQLPDGRSVNFHRIWDTELDFAQQRIGIHVGSWATVEEAISHNKPDAISLVIAPAPDMPSAVRAALDTVAASADFVGCEVVDFSDYNRPETPRVLVSPPETPSGPPIEFAMLPEWRLANDFYRLKEGVTLSELDGITSGALSYSHSVFNVSTGTHWSRTFKYTKDGHVFHIKVKDGAVTDWYKQGASLNGDEKLWVAFDLNTGNPVEYYELHEMVMVKYLVGTDEPLAEWNLVKFPVTGFPELPPDFDSELNNFRGRASIFAWSRKTYGNIVEYTETWASRATPFDVSDPLKQWLKSNQ